MSNSPLRIVVDIGNSRIKWGLCAADAVTASVSLAPDDPSAWQHQLTPWNLLEPVEWAIGSVHPERRDRFEAWLLDRGHGVRLISNAMQLPLRVAVEQPDRVGLDRLLNAVAANTQRKQGRPAVIVDAGTAVTVDYVDEQGAFRGGAILPGLRLAAKALHDYTALLPLVEPNAAIALPGKSTTEALQAGIYCAVAGGIREAIDKTKNDQSNSDIDIFLTGGDAQFLSGSMHKGTNVWPLMTLEGLRLAAWPKADA